MAVSGSMFVGSKFLLMKALMRELFPALKPPTNGTLIAFSFSKLVESSYLSFSACLQADARRYSFAVEKAFSMTS